MLGLQDEYNLKTILCAIGETHCRKLSTLGWKGLISLNDTSVKADCF